MLQMLASESTRSSWDSTGGSGEVQEDEDREWTGISCTEELVGDLNKGCFCAVFKAETGVQRDYCYQGISSGDTTTLSRSLEMMVNWK